VGLISETYEQAVHEVILLTSKYGSSEFYNT